ncbi:MAG: VCBS repeat-containing protein [Alphaproteobacteria bacterium]|nr:VCBS repeat-containing protein [Alphaproteobacteria bacterium]
MSTRSLVALLLVGCGVTPTAAPPDGVLVHTLDRVPRDLVKPFDVDAGRLVARVTGVHQRAILADGGLALGRDGAVLRATAWGRAGGMRPLDVVPATHEACASDATDCVPVVAYDHGPIDAWWVSREDGLEQGFDVAKRPEGDGPLVLEVSAPGMHPRVDGDRVRFRDRSGRGWHVSALVAWDAAGTDLPSHFEVDGDLIRLVVDDTDAAYPITVDPLYDTDPTIELRDPTGSTTSSFGRKVLGVGDLDQDGHEDIAVTAPSDGAGKVYLYYGNGAGGFSHYRVLRGEGDGDQFGFSVSAGDVNGDGWIDLAVGAPYNDDSGDTDCGAAYVYHGGPSGFSDTWDDAHAGTEPGDKSGWVVDITGDGNSDGYDDLLVSQPGYENNPLAVNTGRWRIHFGSASGVDQGGTSWANTLSGLDGNDHCGKAVAWVLDSSGDDDVMMGCEGFDPFFVADAGKVGFYETTSTGPTLYLQKEGLYQYSHYGYFIKNVGNISDGDGDEIAVGAPGGTPSGDTWQAGYVRVFKDVNGLSYPDAPPAFDIADTSANARRARFGTDATGIGDLDGDGYDELVIAQAVDDDWAHFCIALDRGTSDAFDCYATFERSDGWGISLSSANLVGLSDEDLIVGIPGAAVVQVYTVDPDFDADDDGVDDDEDCAAYDPNAWTWGGVVPADFDGDGHGDPTFSEIGCVGDGGTPSRPADDCDDEDATVYTDAPELCDGKDNDCDTEVDEDPVDGTTFYADLDGDGFGNAYGGFGVRDACEAPAQYVTDVTDCDDGRDWVHPGGTEVCDDLDLDEDCSGQSDDADPAVTALLTWYADADGDGSGDPAGATTQACEAPVGYGPPEDCDDTNAAIHPDADEVCDDGAVDENCDGVINDGDASDGLVGWGIDNDGDGYGASAGAVISCSPPGDGYAPAGDCDDTTRLYHPGQPDLCNGIDEDCDGTVDEDCGCTWFERLFGTGYWICDQPLAWADAVTACEDLGGYLSHPAGDQEGFLVSRAAGFDVGDTWWLGVTDSATEGTWLHEDGTTPSSLLLRWAPGEPSGGDAQDCMYLLTDDGKHYDDDCAVARGFICETQDCDVLWYLDEDGDGHAGTTTYFGCGDRPANAYATSTDCDDTDPGVNPDAVEICDGLGVDEDCSGSADAADADAVWTTAYADVDGDGYGDPDTEVVQCAPAGVDQVTVGGDCDDTRDGVHPGAVEVCDDLDLDEDCSGTADGNDADLSTMTAWWPDADGDGHGTDGSATGGFVKGVLACNPPGHMVASTDDCDDTDADVHPGAVEVCDDLDVDEDCSGAADDDDADAVGQVTFYVDADLDGYGDAASSFEACNAVAGRSTLATDCNDANAAIHPGAVEVCDDFDIDEDCSGAADDADGAAVGSVSWYVDADGDGYGDPATEVAACDQPTGLVDDGHDCDDADDALRPGAVEDCDGIDNDCNGTVDDGAPDADADGLCDTYDRCTGVDATGDFDGDGTCDDLDPVLCDATLAPADIDGDGVADGCDPCGEAATDDGDGDGACDTPGVRAFDGWPHTRVATGILDGPSSIEVVDYDEDGDDDVVVGEQNGRAITVFKGNGTTLSGTQAFGTANFYKITDAVFADVDGDGDLDGVASATAGVGILWWRHDGGYSRIVIDNAPPGVPRGVDAGDVDEDGDADIVCACDAGGLALYVSDGGTFTGDVALPTNGQGAKDVKLADADGDGHLDLFTVWSNGAVTLSPGDGTGAFGTPVSIHGSHGVGLYATDLRVSDHDGDGDPDVSVRGSSGLLVLRNDLTSLGAFTPTSTPSGAVGGFEVRDVAGDGAADLVTVVGGQIRWQHRVGGSFGPTQTVGVDADASFVAALDVDGDGDLDLAVVSGANLDLYVNPFGGTDADADGWDDGLDCDDTDATRIPVAASCVDELDSDCDGSCDSVDLCTGDDTTGDVDGDGLCGDVDDCRGTNASGDTDLDGVCDDLDLCEGDDLTGDGDLDGVCDDTDLCPTDRFDDSDGDGSCDSVDLCTGDDITGDGDLDGVCDDTDPCPLDNPDDADGDGWCDSDFRLEVGVVTPGERLTLRVVNAPPNAQVLLAASYRSADGGPCLTSQTGVAQCADLESPYPLGLVRADASGSAAISPRVPANAPVGHAVWFQAITRTGDGAVTPVVARTFEAP